MKVGLTRTHYSSSSSPHARCRALATSASLCRQLELKEGVQSMRFPPVAGRLFCFRILSAHDPESGNDPMVLAAGAPSGSINPLAPKKAGSISISEFRVHEFKLAAGP